MKLSVSKRNQPIQKIDLGKDVLAFDYSETIFLIGRSKDCHIVLDDKQISREHLQIIHKNGKWSVEKISPDNIGTINGENFQRKELEDGDVISVNQFSLGVEFSLDGVVENVVESKSQRQTENTIIEEPAQINNKSSIEIKTPVKLEKPEVIPRVNQETTGEIEADLLEDESKENFTADINDHQEENAHSDFASFDELEKVDPAEELSSLVDQDTEVEMAMGDAPNEESNNENDSYSLENIDNGGDDDSTRVMQSFARVQLELFGETAPYDKYILENEKTFIGRDPAKCQIVLNDTEVSSVHAVIIKNNILITLEDLNSSNGTLLNGDRINKATLNHNDEFVIGGVSFTVKVKSDFLKEENSTLMAVDEDQTVEVEEVVEVQAEEGENVDALGNIVSSEPEEKSFIKRIWKDEKKRKNAIIGIVVLVGAWVMLSDDEQPQKPAKANAKKSGEAVVKKEETTSINKNTGRKLTDDEKRSLSARYEIGKNHYYSGRYREALDEFQKIAQIDPNFNSSLQSLIALSKEGLSKLEEQEKKRVAEQLAAEKRIKIKDLVAKASQYVKDRRVDMAQDTFNEIAKLDPENIEISKLKMELDDWQKEKAKKELEIASAKKAREDKVEKLKPGKTLYLQKEWYKTISKLEDFLRIKDMDEDLIKEATEMLKVSRDEITSATAPLLGKAKSLMEGQDLKGAYEVYQQILKVEPSNAEALNQTGEIKDQLTNKARKIYREAIISESLSLFQDAKEKFQEVQQISPVDSDYYKKATDKLKEYLE